jgi:hypothetical protein
MVARSDVLKKSRRAFLALNNAKCPPKTTNNTTVEDRQEGKELTLPLYLLNRYRRYIIS